MGGTEWSLVLFTLLVQAAVGLFLTSEVMAGSLARNSRRDSISPEHVQANVLSLALAVAGIGFSFFHLGSPENALHVLNNWQSSWLSREILFVLIFAVLSAALSFLRWKRALSASTQRIMAVLAGASGLMLIFSMSKLYMLPTVPPWNNLGTPVVFFAAALLLGCQIFGLTSSVGIYRLRHLPIEAKNIFAGRSQKILGRIVRFSLLLIILQFSFVLLFYERFHLPAHKFAVGAQDLDLKFQSGFVVRLSLLAIAALVLIFLLTRIGKTGAGWPDYRFLAYGVFCLVLISEFIDRCLFFAAYYRLGL